MMVERGVELLLFGRLINKLKNENCESIVIYRVAFLYRFIRKLPEKHF